MYHGNGSGGMNDMGGMGGFNSKSGKGGNVAWVA